MEEVMYYKFDFDGQYIKGYYAVFEEEEYDYSGQISDDLIESLNYGGWYKFENNNFIEDPIRKAEMIAKKKEEDEKPTWQETTDAQVIYTAMMTDTLIEEE